MSINCISLGVISKYMFLVFLDSFVYICSFALESNSKILYKESYHPFVYLIIYSFSLCLSFSLLLINKICSKRKNNKVNHLISQENNPHFSNSVNIKRVSKKEKFLWFLLVSFIDFIVIFINLVLGISLILLNSMFFGILFLSLFSYKILKYKLYKHHYLSIIIILISFLIAIITYFYHSKAEPIDYLIVSLLGIIDTALYSLELTIDKYLIFSKYINSFEILFFQGIIELILGVISLTITTKFDFIDNFFDYYNKLDKKEVIILISLIINNFIYYPIALKIIDIFSPFFVLFIPLISLIIMIIISFAGIAFSINYSTIVDLFLFFLSFIFFLIFTEIIELNCLGLSYMTKRNIESRAKLDSIVEGDEIVRSDTEIGLEGYIIELNEFKQEEKITLNNNESSKED